MTSGKKYWPGRSEVISDPSYVPAAIKRGNGGKMAVYLADVFMAEEHGIAEAISSLCEYAVRQKVEIVITITVSGSGKRYMHIDHTGFSRPVSAPAPSTSTHVPNAEGFSKGLGSADTDELTGADWVDRYVLDPTAETPTGPPSKKKKRRFTLW